MLNYLKQCSCALIVASSLALSTQMFADVQVSSNQTPVQSSSNVLNVLNAAYAGDSQVNQSLVKLNNAFINSFSKYSQRISAYALPLIIIPMKQTSPIRGIYVYYKDGDMHRFAISGPMSQNVWFKIQVLAHLPALVAMKLLPGFYENNISQRPAFQSVITQLLNDTIQIQQQLTSVQLNMPKAAQQHMQHILQVTNQFLHAVQHMKQIKPKTVTAYLNSVNSDVMYFITDYMSQVKLRLGQAVNTMSKHIAKGTTVYMIYQGDAAVPKNDLYTKTLMADLKKYGINTFLVSTTDNQKSVDQLRSTVMGNYMGSAVIESAVLNKNIANLWNQLGAMSVVDSTQTSGSTS